MGNIRIEFERALIKKAERNLFEAEYSLEMDGLDLDFIKNASTSNTFKLDAKDFQSLKYKNEIRFLISKRWFPDLQMSDLFLSAIDLNSLNAALNTIHSANKSGFLELLQEEPKGMGPGEVLLYFLLDNAHLGGAKSKGVDLIDNGTEYEIKAAKRNATTGTLYNFKLGAVKGISKIASKIMDLKEELLKFYPDMDEGEDTGVKKIHLEGFKSNKFLKHIKNTKLEGWDALLIEFQKAAYQGYFKNHPIIFVGSKTASKDEIGRIYNILDVQQKQIGMSVTSGTIKPRVNPNL